jgi:signal transduction histidine kinase
VLQQALVNLMLNGVQAMAAVPADSRRLHVRSRREAGEAVIEIADTGPGFPPEAVDRAFDAFFTTKPGGMGLGLAICQSAVAAHDGRIAVLPPAPGEPGARIEIRLPAQSR